MHPRLTLEALFPLMTCSVAWGACAGLWTLRLWLFVLPSRLMKKTSIPTMVRGWFDDRHGLIITSCSYWAWLICCGVVGWFNGLRWVASGKGGGGGTHSVVIRCRSEALPNIEA